MKSIINFNKESLFVFGYLLVVFLMLFSGIFLGLIPADEGWMLSSYQNLFSHPQSTSYTFLYYNTILIGGVWNLIFGGYGILSFRILFIICELLKALLVYLILRKHCNKWGILIGYMLLIYKGNFYNYFYYDQLTSLICLLAILFIVKSLENRSWLYMLIGGAIVGINVFTRIPNIALCALILVLVLYWIHTKDLPETWRLFLAAVGGFFAGCLFMALLMLCLGHFSIFVNNLTSGFAASSSSDSTHNLSSMATTYIYQLQDIWMKVAAIIACSACLFVLQKKFKQHGLLLSGLCLFVVFMLLIACRRFSQSNEINYENQYAILTFMLLYALIYMRKEIAHIALLALIMVYAVPLGADYGYGSNCIYHAMCLAMPASIAIFVELVMERGKQFHYTVTLPMALCLFFIIGVNQPIRYAKRTMAEYKTLRTKNAGYRVNSSLADNIILSEELAGSLNTILSELQPYVKPDDKLLVFQSTPILHYLTQTQPYIENSWPWTFTSDDMERHFYKALQENIQLPVIVREKYDDPNWDNSNAPESRKHKNKKIKLIQDFIQDNGYIVVWEDKTFQLLLPPCVKCKV